MYFACGVFFDKINTCKLNLLIGLFPYDVWHLTSLSNVDKIQIVLNFNYQEKEWDNY